MYAHTARISPAPNRDADLLISHSRAHSNYIVVTVYCRFLTPSPTHPPPTSSTTTPFHARSCVFRVSSDARSIQKKKISTIINNKVYNIINIIMFNSHTPRGFRGWETDRRLRAEVCPKNRTRNRSHKGPCGGCRRRRRRCCFSFFFFLYLNVCNPRVQSGVHLVISLLFTAGLPISMGTAAVVVCACRPFGIQYNNI